MDMLDYTKTAHIGGKKYVLVIAVNYSGFTWVMFLANKHESFTNFEIFCKRIQK